MTTNYELFWLRELPGGALGGAYGGNRTALTDLPINETLAGRIRAMSLPDAEVSLHLPFLSHRDRKDWPARQLDLAVNGHDGSRIVVGDLADHQYAALLAGSKLAGRPAAAPILFHDDRTWAAHEWDSSIAPMLKAHRICLAPDWRPAGPVRVRWTIELPAQQCSSWADIPHRREALFLEQFRGLSTAVQRALRVWIPHQYLAQPERYSKPNFAYPYMVYATLPPHPSRRKTQLTFHVLEPQRVVRSMTRLGKQVAEHLRRAQARMEKSGIGPREEYLAEDATRIVRSMHGLPRVFASLLSLEAFVVEEFVGFASIAHDLREAPLKARMLAEPGLALLHSLRCRLARSQGGESFENLANLILVAATSGLSWRERRDKALRARVTVTELESDREIQGESEFSYANS
jgi:hypothetical protein